MIFNVFDFRMELSWAINWKLLRAFLCDFPCFFVGFPRGNPMNYGKALGTRLMENLLKWHENLVIFKLKYSQVFKGF